MLEDELRNILNECNGSLGSTQLIDFINLHYKTALVNYIRSKFPQQQSSSDDIYQNLMKSFLTSNRQPFTPQDPNKLEPCFKGFLFRAVYNQANNAQRNCDGKAKSGKRVFKSIDDGDGELRSYAKIKSIREEQIQEKIETTVLLELAFGAPDLTIREKDIIVLRHFEQKEYGEIAIQLGIGKGSVGTTLKRGLEKMRKHLETLDNTDSRSGGVSV